ncbi:hypothetical protein [Pelobacter propionicus]|uniref:Uncharacterized protein n=1 Tax=Pelobacter propionicus (strain DSM 2379 / NBRC 103807 / OttBd1) TaxID=338966 RepID=A1ATN9_PELPD|nr:hypothetical protein [Pelobacter propionicus]ABL00710.1 hypothetical protein Ppro_3116 [Pelobacter propionicus DSM 2379]
MAFLTSRRVLDDLGLWLESESALKASKTVHQGQSPEEVAAVLGEPEKKVILDSKTSVHLQRHEADLQGRQTGGPGVICGAVYQAGQCAFLNCC